MAEFDVIVVGAGQAGPGVAAARAQAGARVALIELDRPGGTCLNHGCKPTKALRASAVLAHRARRGKEYGVGVGEVSVDFPAAMDRVTAMIDEMRQSLVDWLDGQDGLTVIRGVAELVTATDGNHLVHVGDQTHTAREIYLDLGARPVVPRIEGLDRVDYLTEVELLALRALPEHLVVVGGGYIGLEFGQMFRRFGSAVTIIAGGGIAPREDPDVSAAIESFLAAEGITIRHSPLSRVATVGSGIVGELADGRTIDGSHLLVATGRQPNSDLIGDDTNLAVDEHGYFVIDSRFATSVPGVWALGDVNGRGAFTHTAYQDSQILLDPTRNVTDRITSYAMFTDPPLGRVGMTEAEAWDSGRTVLKAELPMSQVSRAILEGETIGLMRILVDGDSEEILGATFLGMHGDDLAQLIGFAMQSGVRYPQLRDALPIHPTVAEYIPTLLAALH